MVLEQGEALGVVIDGRLEGTVVLTRFGQELASISMMVVTPGLGRSGLGASLLGAALEAAGSATVFLYATDMGHGLYLRHGFVDAGATVRLLGPFSGQPPHRTDIRHLRRADHRGGAGARRGGPRGAAARPHGLAPRGGRPAGGGRARRRGGRLRPGPRRRWGGASSGRWWRATRRRPSGSARRWRPGPRCRCSSTWRRGRRGCSPGGAPPGWRPSRPARSWCATATRCRGARAHPRAGEPGARVGAAGLHEPDRPLHAEPAASGARWRPRRPASTLAARVGPEQRAEAAELLAD